MRFAILYRLVYQIAVNIGLSSGGVATAEISRAVKFVLIRFSNFEVRACDLNARISAPTVVWIVIDGFAVADFCNQRRIAVNSIYTLFAVRTSAYADEVSVLVSERGLVSFSVRLNRNFAVLAVGVGYAVIFAAFVDIGGDDTLVVALAFFVEFACRVVQ